MVCYVFLATNMNGLMMLHTYKDKCSIKFKNMYLICQTPDFQYIFHTAMLLPEYEISIGLTSQRRHSH